MDDVTSHIRLTLLQGFDLEIDGESVAVPPATQRLLAFLALSPTGRSRREVHAVLWPDREEQRAAANLRSSLWRLPEQARAAVEIDGEHLRLRPTVRCDLDDALERSRRLTSDAVILDGSDLDVRLLLHDLLPSWYEDWVLTERERLRQLRIHALEALCERLTAVGRFGEAIEAGLAAVSADPLRESASRVLILAHLAEGNRSEALRQYELYASLLHDDLGIGPTDRLRGLIDAALER
jgi:DNA-binding SARP family transcriptional activator